MNKLMKKRDFLVAGFSAGLSLSASGQAWAQAKQWIDQRDGTKPPPGAKQIPRRTAKTTKLFRSPPYGNADDARKNNDKATYPNALAIMTDAPGGVWIAEQKMSGPIAGLYPACQTLPT